MTKERSTSRSRLALRSGWRRKPVEDLAPEFPAIPRLLVLHRPVSEVRFRVPTTDEWFPCFENHTVEVSLHRDAANAWRISISGDDDDERDRTFETEEEMRQTAARLPVPITKAWLKANRFVPGGCKETPCAQT